MNKTLNIVISVQDHIIVVYCSDREKVKILKDLGAKRQVFNRNKWLLSYGSKNELSELFTSLRDYKFVFAGGSSGWYPASIFQKLKDERLLRGRALEIVWESKDSYKIREI